MPRLKLYDDPCPGCDGIGDEDVDHDFFCPILLFRLEIDRWNGSVTRE